MNLEPIIQKIDDSLKTKSNIEKKKLYKTLDIDFMEKTKYLELNARKFASGLITLEESQYIYNKLIEYDKTTLAERIIITKLMMELLQKH